MLAIIKACIACGGRKPIEDFYTHPAMSDGYLNKCKECCKQHNRENRSTKLDYYRQYDRNRANEPLRFLARIEYASTERGKQLDQEDSKRWIKRNPEKRKAHSAVSNAIRDGKLKRLPCELCYAEKAQAHHADYSKPLEVRWFCTECHAVIHKDEREQRRLKAVWRPGDRPSKEAA